VASVDEALNVISDFKPEVLFLDICMPGKNGFQLLEEIDSSKIHVIFTTAHNEYALKALKEGALDYLEKPISIDDLEHCAERISQRSSSDIPSHDVLKEVMRFSNLKEMDRTTIPTSDGFIVVKSADIVRLEACESYTRIFLKNEEKHLSSKNIRVFEDSLNPAIFFRTHKSHIVNILYHLRGFSRSDGNVALMSNGVKVPVSRRKLNEFLQRASA
jgi:two-component system LytT family response regulator